MKTLRSRLALLSLLLVPSAGCVGSGPAALAGGTGGAGTTTAATTGSGGATGGSGGGATSGSSTASSSSSSTSSSTGSSTSSSTSSGATSSSSSSSSSSSTGTTVVTPKPKGCITDVSAGHHVFPCAGGITYDVEISTACAAGGCGLVLDMHGYTMTAAQEDLATGMRALGDEHGYVVVQPNAAGTPSSWNQLTDVPSVFAFVSDAATALVTDAKRAHVMGFSQGGGMTWRMVCSHADFFASASPLAGIEGCEFVTPNVPSRPVPMMMVHGTQDSVVSFSAIAVPLRDAALSYWNEGTGAVFAMDATHTATRYLTPAGTVFELWQHDYSAGNVLLGGHCAPGGSDVGPAVTQYGCQSSTFVYGQAAMAFFIAHPQS